MLSKDNLDIPLAAEADWPVEDLESVELCPMCHSRKRKLLYTGVKDWAFKCAPGNWGVYNCFECKSLYLNPRPSKKSINKAYGKYYTHESSNESNSFKAKLHNEFMFHKFGLDSSNRLNLIGNWWVPILNPFIYRKFPLDDLMQLPRGRLLDVGCGNGDFLITAKQLGYSVYGLEIDVHAYMTASKRGLEVWHGSYEILDKINLKFDYIVCSHVIEHVHDPVHFLNSILKVSKPYTTLMLAWPNPNSIVLKWFKKHWRGLEAPRHLCLPSLESIVSELTKLGFGNFRVYPSPIHTFGESLAIKLERRSIFIQLLNKLVYLATSLIKLKENQDILEVACTKK